MEPLVMFVLLTFAYYAGRKIALFRIGAQTMLDEQLGIAARFFVEGGLLTVIFVAVLRKLTSNP